jgi:hypothetical protein
MKQNQETHQQKTPTEPHWLKKQFWKKEALITLEEKITAFNKLSFLCQIQRPELN